MGETARKEVLCQGHIVLRYRGRRGGETTPEFINRTAPELEGLRFNLMAFFLPSRAEY